MKYEVGAIRPRGCRLQSRMLRNAVDGPPYRASTVSMRKADGSKVRSISERNGASAALTKTPLAYQGSPRGPGTVIAPSDGREHSVLWLTCPHPAASGTEWDHTGPHCQC